MFYDVDQAYTSMAVSFVKAVQTCTTNGVFWRGRCTAVRQANSKLQDASEKRDRFQSISDVKNQIDISKRRKLGFFDAIVVLKL
eukprot:8721401-Pyramimonas_sp.AAC.1